MCCKSDRSENKQSQINGNKPHKRNNNFKPNTQSVLYLIIP